VAAADRPVYRDWTAIAPLLGLIVLAVTWGRHLPVVAVVLVAFVLAGAVLAAVHHAEIVPIEWASRSARWF
jgi:Ca2+:H+ antiporter